MSSPVLIIPAAGRGTRMKSVNPDLPKEMLNVRGVPAIQYAVEEGIAAGVSRVVIVVSPGKGIIRDYFENSAVARSLSPDGARRLEDIHGRCQLHFVVQEEPRGEAHAIGLARPVAGPGPVAAIYPDNLCFPARSTLADLKRTFEARGADVIALAPAVGKNPKGVFHSGRVDLAPVEGEPGLYRVVRLHPKRDGPFRPRSADELRAVGIYVFGPHLFDYVERATRSAFDGELTDAPVFDLIMSERGLFGRSVGAEVFDIGAPAGYRDCLRAMAGNVAGSA